MKSLYTALSPSPSASSMQKSIIAFLSLHRGLEPTRATAEPPLDLIHDGKNRLAGVVSAVRAAEPSPERCFNAAFEVSVLVGVPNTVHTMMSKLINSPNFAGGTTCGHACTSPASMSSPTW